MTFLFKNKNTNHEQHGIHRVHRSKAKKFMTYGRQGRKHSFDIEKLGAFEQVAMVKAWMNGLLNE